MNISTALASAAAMLAEHGIAEPRREASSLMAFVLRRDRAFLIAHPEHILSDSEVSRFADAVARRSRHEPSQYIVGKQGFYGLEFEVTPEVLIPRPETEILVEEAVRFLSAYDAPRFCEAGIGSGCISVAILHSIKASRAVAGDVSAAALAVAGRNAVRHGVSGRLELRETDLLEGIDGPFELIVSNPPYVPDSQVEALQAEVRLFEPHIALSGGPEGTDLIARLASQSPGRLAPGGALLLEIGFDQAERVSKLFGPDIWASVGFLADLQGIPRILAARLA